MKIMIIYENMPERTDVYLVDDNDGNRHMADVLSGHFVGVDESDQVLDAHEHLTELMDSGDAELMWSSDIYGGAIPIMDISMVCITGAVL